MDGRLFGVDILDVKEVTAETTYTPRGPRPRRGPGPGEHPRAHLPGASTCAGCWECRPRTVTGDSRLVLFKPSVGSAFGVVVDEISEIQTVDANRIESFAQNDHEAAPASVRRVDLIDCRLQAGR